MDDVRDEARSQPVGKLITQVAKSELIELLEESLKVDFDLDALCQSDRKKDRVKARKLFCLLNCLSALGQPMLERDWRWIHFRAAGNGLVQAEVVMR